MDLPPAQAKLYEALAGKGDVAIDDLCRAIGKEPPENAQQFLGSYIVKLNRRLAARKLVVKPGQLKRTYRLQVL